MKKSFYSSKTVSSFSITKYAMNLIDKANIVFVKETEETYYRDETGVSRPATNIEIERLIASGLISVGEKVNSSKVREIKQQLYQFAKQVSYSAFNVEHLILFKNGVLDTSTMQFSKEIPPNVYFTNYVPFNYKKNPDTPKVFSNYLSHLVKGDVEAEKLLWEIVGVVISNYYGYRSKKAFMLVGKGDSGKSQYIKLLSILTGGNGDATELSELDKRFALASIYDKRVVGSADTNYLKSESINALKLLTGGDYISVEKKGKNKFTALYKGLLVFGSNNYPLFSGDKGEHVYRRLCIIPCNNSLSPEEMDASILEKMVAEGDDIVSIAINYLIQWRNRGFVFTYPELSKKALEEYKMLNSPELMFYDECCAPCKPGKNPYNSNAIFEKFRDWCRVNCPDYRSNKKNFERILAAELKVPDIKTRSGDTRTYIFTIKE